MDGMSSHVLIAMMVMVVVVVLFAEDDVHGVNNTR